MLYESYEAGSFWLALGSVRTGDFDGFLVAF